MHTFWDRCYEEHFTRYFGKPFDRETYRGAFDDRPLQITTHDHAYPGYRVYTSLGLTAYEPEVRELAEAMVLADAGGQQVPYLFVNALFYVTEQRIPLTSKFAVGGVDRLARDFARRFDKVALFFTVVTQADKFPEGFEEVDLDGDVGLIYQALFISEEEHEYLRRHGGQAFEEQLRGQDADLCSLRRPSCV
jgi:hypothetical protein